MSQIFFESDTLKTLSPKELYFRFKIVEKRYNMAISSKIPFEMKSELDNLVNAYTNEIDNRVASMELSLDDLDDWDDFYYEHENEIIKLSNEHLLNDSEIRKL